MHLKHNKIADFLLQFVRRGVNIAVRYGDGVALSQPFLGVSSLNFGPLFSGLFSVCRACSTVRRCKSSTQPDDGEGLAKRKGVIVRWGLKEAWSKTAT
jgi:hypothetical protein